MGEPRHGRIISWYYYGMVVPSGDTTVLWHYQKLNIVYFYFKYSMNFRKKENQGKVHKIRPYSNTIELGRTIGFEGTMEILSYLFNGSKRYRDIEANIEIKKTTLVRQLKRLQALKIIETHEIFAEGRKTHEYAITQNGKDLLRFSNEYEKRMRTPVEQQKIIEIEKNNIESH